MTHPDRKALRAPLIASGVLVAFVVAITAVAQTTGLGAWRAEVDEPVETLTLAFVDREDGAVLVYDAADGAHRWTYGAGQHGFVRGALRAVAHERKVAGLPDGAPFHVTRHADGKLSIADPLTGVRVVLNGFGAPNAEEFAWLFEAGPR